MKTLIPLFACLALGLGSCASDDHSTTQPMAQAMNTTCPMSGEPVDASVTSTYDGQTIAFCCTMCQSKFDRMSDSEKASTVSKIK